MDFDNFEGSEDEFYVNLQQIANDTTVLPTIRLLAMDLMQNPYLTLGDWFRSLNDLSLHELMQVAEETIKDEDSPMMEHLMLLTLMLAQAEGTLTNMNEMEELGNQISMMRNYLAIVSLARKGLVRVYYENLTLGSDMGDRVVVEKI